jgi:hypothetical protein
MSLVINGQKIEVPGLVTKSWLDPNGPPKNVKCNTYNDRKVSGIVLHTVHGDLPNTIELNPDGTPAVSTDEHGALAYATYWHKKEAKNASATLVVAADGAVLCLNDILDEVSWHACGANNFTIGIEMYQTNHGTVYKATYDATIKLLNFLTEYLRIQRQVSAVLVNGKRVPVKGVVPRLNQDGHGPAGVDFYGIWGHRNNTSNRGPGDPGDVIFQLLLDAGYEGFDLNANEDRHVWEARQKALGVPEASADGIPGKKTCDLLERNGHPHGIWVKIP